MKKLFLCLAVLGWMAAGCEKNDDDKGSERVPDFAPRPELPDPSDVCSGMEDDLFKAYCLAHFDTDSDGKIAPEEAAAAAEIALSGAAYGNVRSLRGIGYFTGLKTLNCSGCSRLEQVDLSCNLEMKEIGERAFYKCGSLTGITIPDGIAKIGDYAFYNCSGLTSLTIPAGVTSIGNHAFYGCSGLTGAAVPESVAEIGDYAFYSCSGLTGLAIPDGITKIGDYVFYNCSGLTSLTISEGATSIGSYALYNCSGLTSLTIPEGVTSIGNHAFYRCSGLAEIYCKPIDRPALGAFACSGIAPEAKIYVPAQSAEDYRKAAEWSAYASLIEGYGF